MQVEAEAGPAESMVVEEDESCYATYQLTGVLTHKGNTADGGHYVAWIRKDDGTWYLFDDHKVSVFSIPHAGGPVGRARLLLGCALSLVAGQRNIGC